MAKEYNFGKPGKMNEVYHLIGTYLDISMNVAGRLYTFNVCHIRMTYINSEITMDTYNWHVVENGEIIRYGICNYTQKGLETALQYANKAFREYVG